MTDTEALVELLPRVEALQQGLGQWRELVERLTADGDELDPVYVDFVTWAVRSLARSLVAIDGEVEEALAPAPEIPQPGVVQPLKLVAVAPAAE